MKNIVLLSIMAMIVSGCNSGVAKIKDKPVVSYGNNVIISQDGFDKDNFSMVSIGASMHKAHVLNVIAIDITGRDLDNRTSTIFSALTMGTDIPILVNHADISTRVTPNARIYDMSKIEPNDGILDSQRLDSTIGLQEALEASSGDVSYVVGGHLHNLASLMKYDLDVVKRKITTLVLSTGWSSRTDYIPEMNLSEGRNYPTGTSDATRYVFDNLPSSVKVIIVTDPYSDDIPFSLNLLDDDSILKYLMKYGHYSDGDIAYKGDYAALAYSADVEFGKEAKTCLKVNSYGAVGIASGQCNNYYLYDVNGSMLNKSFLGWVE